MLSSVVEPSRDPGPLHTDRAVLGLRQLRVAEPKISSFSKASSSFRANGEDEQATFDLVEQWYNVGGGGTSGLDHWAGPLGRVGR